MTDVQLTAVTSLAVLRTMLEGMILVFGVQWLFLGDLRSAIARAATAPFALVFAIIVMALSGQSGNLPLAGSAGFGLTAITTVIMVETLYGRFAEISGRSARAVGETPLEANRSIFFSAAIITAGFLPLLALVGVEGHAAGAAAKAYACAIAGGLLASFAISPILAALLPPQSMAEAVAMRVIHGLRRPSPAGAFTNRAPDPGKPGDVASEGRRRLAALNRRGD